MASENIKNFKVLEMMIHNSQNIIFVGMQIYKIMFMKNKFSARRQKFLKGWFQVSNFF